MVKVKLTDSAEADELMDALTYRESLGDRDA